MQQKLLRICGPQINGVFKVCCSSIAKKSFNRTLIKKYACLLNDYWQPNGKAQRYHEMNRILVPQIYNAFMSSLTVYLDDLMPQSKFKEFKVLDIGCGGGITCESLAKLNFDVVGVDPNPDLVRIAQSHQNKNKDLKNKSLRYHNSTLEDFNKTCREKFDVIVISEVLEHIPFWKKDEFMELSLSFCKNGGKIFITTIDSSFIAFRDMCSMFAQDTFHEILPNSFNGISQQKLTWILRTNGCAVRNSVGIELDIKNRKFEFSSENPAWVYVYAIKQNL